MCQVHLKSLDFEYNNFYDIQEFFTEFNDKHDGYEPISLRRIYKKFFNIDIKKSKNDCIQNAVYSIQIYEEIILDWKNISKKYKLIRPPFEQYEFSKIRLIFNFLQYKDITSIAKINCLCHLFSKCGLCGESGIFYKNSIQHLLNCVEKHIDDKRRS